MAIGTMPILSSHRAPWRDIRRPSPSRLRQSRPLIDGHAELFGFLLATLVPFHDMLHRQMLRLLHGNNVLLAEFFCGSCSTHFS